MKALLCLEDGFVLEGESIGAAGETFGEVVFNTSMTGYQEILTDPSYRGQIVTMTYPHIGNYGVNREDVESRRPFVEGFVVRELSPIASNHRAEASLEEYLKKNRIVGIQGIDTRALTRHLRTEGAKQGGISTIESDPRRLIEKVKASPHLVGRNLVKEVTCDRPYRWPASPAELAGEARQRRPQTGREGRFHVVAIDCGIKLNILRVLESLGCRITVVPAATPPHAILEEKPDGLFLSNGPGDPEAVTEAIETTHSLLDRLPIFGICLGHQILGLSLGGKTYKLKFGHHGGNHPVMDLATRKVQITTQNHGFAVDVESIPGQQVMLTHVNLNDQTAEGMAHKKLPVYSVQYHPEAAPGPHDARELFQRFLGMMEKR